MAGKLTTPPVWSKGTGFAGLRLNRARSSREQGMGGIRVRAKVGREPFTSATEFIPQNDHQRFLGP